MENIPLGNEPAEDHQLLGDDASVAYRSPHSIAVSSLSTPSSPDADPKGNRLRKIKKRKSWKRREKSKRASETLSTKIQKRPAESAPTSAFFKNWGLEWASVTINVIIFTVAFADFYKGGIVLNQHPALTMNIVVSIIAVLFKTCFLITVSSSKCTKNNGLSF